MSSQLSASAPERQPRFTRCKHGMIPEWCSVCQGLRSTPTVTASRGSRSSMGDSRPYGPNDLEFLSIKQRLGIDT